MTLQSDDEKNELDLINGAEKTVKLRYFIFLKKMSKSIPGPSNSMMDVVDQCKFKQPDSSG